MNQVQLKASPITIEIFEAEISGTKQRCIDARALHSTLDNATRFSMWIARKVEEFMFEEGKDFFPNLGKSSGGRPSTEYIISIDMAKELCMLERSEIGRATRKYFIECERKLLNASMVTATQETALGKQLSLVLTNSKKRITNLRRNFIAYELKGCLSN